MKIASIEIIRLNNGSPTVKNTDWQPTIVKVIADDGTYGIGEIGLAYGNAKFGSFGMAQDFAKLIIGMNPFNTEQIWEKLYRSTFWGMGGGGVIFAAMSAIDNALWDLKGKKLGVPVYVLLGGKTNTKLRTYASQIQFDWGVETNAMTTPEDYYNVTKKVMKEGYNSVKVDPVGFDLEGNWMSWSNYGLLEYKQLKVAEDRIAAIREAGGPDMDIIVELHALTDANSSVQLARILEKYRIFYYEEPTSPLSVSNMKEIANRVNIPIAAGERIYTRWGYQQFFEQRALHIIQPDLGNCGGISEGKKICDVAKSYDVGVQMHICGGPVATATTLQIEAYLTNFVIHEHHAVAMQKANIAFCVNDYQPKNGYYEIPDLPGIGQDISEWGYKNADIVTVQ